MPSFNLNFGVRVKTVQGHEVDFLATQSDGGTQLIQVAATIENESTFQREIRSLVGARIRHARTKGPLGFAE